MKRPLLCALSALLLPLAVQAAPNRPPPSQPPTPQPMATNRPAVAPGPAAPAVEAPEHPASSARVLKRMHTRLVMRLGDLFDLDTAATVQLAGRLERFSAERVRLSREVYEAREQLTEWERGGSGDVSAAARRLSKARVDQAQLEADMAAEALKGQSGEKAVRAALFLARTPERMMWLAARAHGRGPWGRPPMGPGCMGPGGMGHGRGGCAGGCQGHGGGHGMGQEPGGHDGQGHRPGGLVPPPPIRGGAPEGGMGPGEDEELEWDWD